MSNPYGPGPRGRRGRRKAPTKRTPSPNASAMEHASPNARFKRGAPAVTTRPKTKTIKGSAPVVSRPTMPSRGKGEGMSTPTPQAKTPIKRGGMAIPTPQTKTPITRSPTASTSDAAAVGRPVAKSFGKATAPGQLKKAAGAKSAKAFTPKRRSI